MTPARQKPVRAASKRKPVTNREHLLTPFEVQKGARFGFTDDGNASRFAEDHKGKLIHAQGPGWYRWNGKLWKPIPKEAPIREARATARKIRQEALRVKDDDAAMKVAVWAHQSASAARIGSMIKLAEGGDAASHADLTIPVSKLDHNPDVLNTPSGIVDLRTGELRESDRAEYCTRITRAAYDSDADQTEWLRFLARVVPDAEVRTALKRCLGASITGHVPKALFLLYGKEGDNGKTQLVEAVISVLGDYAGAAMEATFTNATSREAGYDFATMRGARFVSFSETREDRGLAAERVKRLTGGDTVKARSPYEKPFEYRPSFSLWVPTNHPPMIPAREKAMWKRVWVFPFEVVIPPKEQIPEYGALLANEHGAGVLAWLVEGAKEFYADRLRLGRQPASMGRHLNAWKDRDDIIKRWLADQTKPQPKARERFPDLWKSFRAWCDENGEQASLRTYTSQKFHAEMDDHYPRSAKLLHGAPTREGLVLKEPPSPSRVALKPGPGV